MENEGRKNRRLYVASFSGDIANVSHGDLIPKRVLYTAPAESVSLVCVWYMRPAVLLTSAFLFFSVSVGTVSYGVFRGETSAAAVISATTESVGQAEQVRETLFTDDFTYTAKVAGVQAQHYLVLDMESDTVVAGSGDTSSASIASLTKLMTAVVAFDFIDITERVPVSKGSFVSTLIPRLEGRNTISMESVLQLLLAESSNEVAEVLASTLGRELFIKRMNDKAAYLGLSNTAFTDPSGLDDGNVSSVEDVAVLLQYIYDDYPYILELTANKAFANPYTASQFGSLSNFNYIDEVGFIAGKVGETIAAQQTSASLHLVTVHGDERLLAVVLLGTDERTEDTKKLIAYVREHF
jgi:D-alanyl-D-alanine carboxypeptidase